MNIILFSAAGFIGTNLVSELAKDKQNCITVVDRNYTYFTNIKKMKFPNVSFIESEMTFNTNFEQLLIKQEVVYHLISTTIPSTSNQHISEELKANVIVSAKLLDSCVHQGVKKVIFLSSGGTVYGKESKCPLSEDTITNPITSYGVQKLTIEKLLYLYNYMYGLDYRIIRLSNPYGPYQRPNGKLGAVTTFTYKALKDEVIDVYGDGSIVRDFIYIDDAIRGIITIANGNDEHHIFNLGCGYGTSINQVLDKVKKSLNIDINVKYTGFRKVDVPVNFLDISRYEKAFGIFNPITLEEGIRRTADYMKKELL
jgi:UDP-glucose 4-epimerase